MDAYAPEIERMMKRLYDSLSEDDRRRYAAIEAAKLGHGGTEYIAQILECDPKTIRRGKAELEATDELDTTRVRKRGGCKKAIEINAAVEANFLKVLEDHTAGDPMRTDVKWTNLSRRQLIVADHVNNVFSSTKLIGLPNGSFAQNMRSPHGIRWMPPSTTVQPASIARWSVASRSETAK